MGADVVADGYESYNFGPGEGRRFLSRSVATGTFRKRARVLAVRMTRPFSVHTEHGRISGAPGDWLVTNHPDDDPAGDAWPVSAARFAASYVADEEV